MHMASTHSRFSYLAISLTGYPRVADTSIPNAFSGRLWDKYYQQTPYCGIRWELMAHSNESARAQLSVMKFDPAPNQQDANIE